MKVFISRFKWVVTALMCAAIGVFAVQNLAAVDLTFLTWTFQSRRIVIIAISLFCGLAIGWLFGFSAGRKHDQ